MTNPFSALIDELARHLAHTLDDVVPADRPCALIDYPNHENVGDCAIWAGERAVLHQLQRDVAYVADITAFSGAAMRRRIGGGGTILMHGGGNFGDLYPHHQRLRERVTRQFPDNRIVMLPQTASFRTAESLAAAKIRFRHSNLVLLVRDKQSLDLVDAEFDVPVHLAPDSALALGAFSEATPDIPIVWLARTDDERAETGRPPASMRTADQTVRVADWVGKRSSDLPTLALREATLIGGGLSRLMPALAARNNPWLSNSYDKLAMSRVRHGERLVSRAEVVVTDRLHGHILALLMGRPHVLVNDQYDKVGRFYRTWSSSTAGIKFAEDGQDAWEQAQALLGLTRPTELRSEEPRHA
jgi:exopolysaccharide biosynthesis predicted pyruvyltransferase EpsI